MDSLTVSPALAANLRYRRPFAYTAVMSFIILKLVNAMVGLRVDAEEETQGLDLVLHDERGYDL